MAVPTVAVRFSSHAALSFIDIAQTVSMVHNLIPVGMDISIMIVVKDQGMNLNDLFIIRKQREVALREIMSYRIHCRENSTGKKV